jgi:hypothetical protein
MDQPRSFNPVESKRERHYGEGTGRNSIGQLSCEERLPNVHALIDGSRILSAYRTSLDEKIWIITEAVDDAGQRSATTIPLPSED